MRLDMDQNSPGRSYLDFIKHKTITQGLLIHQFHVTDIICHKINQYLLLYIILTNLNLHD